MMLLASPDDLRRIGAGVRALRHECGLSQRRLADQSGLYFKTIIRIEYARNVPTEGTLSALAGPLGFGSAEALVEAAYAAGDTATT